jgi:hypothetical protein
LAVYHIYLSIHLFFDFITGLSARQGKSRRHRPYFFLLLTPCGTAAYRRSPLPTTAWFQAGQKKGDILLFGSSRFRVLAG